MKQQQKQTNQKPTGDENIFDTVLPNDKHQTPEPNTSEGIYNGKGDTAPGKTMGENMITDLINSLEKDQTKLIENEGDDSSPDKRFVRLENVIGRGSHKLVYKAIDTFDAKEVAWNELVNNNIPEGFMCEINLLKSIDHPNIIKMKDFWFTDIRVYFITELMTSGTLRDYIKNVNPTLRIVRDWATQILRAIEHLHDRSMIHRDIKCGNIFVNGSTGELKVGDLSISKQGRHKGYTIVGTPEFMAREVFVGTGYDQSVDIHAFGMALLEIATGEYPYHECADANEVFKCIMAGIPPRSFFKVKHACLLNLIVRCITHETGRLSVKQCIDHHFISSDPIMDEQESNEETNQPIQGCKECIAFNAAYKFPARTLPEDFSLSMFSYFHNVLNLQMYYKETENFLQFTFDIFKDSVDSVANGMIQEGYFKQKDHDWLRETIVKGMSSIKATIIEHNNVTPMISAWAKEELAQYLSMLENKNKEKTNDGSDLLKTEQPTPPVLTDLDFPDRIFPDEMLIDEFIKETAIVTKRDDNIAQTWIKTIKTQEIKTVGDLKILVDEDWSSLGLTVFSSRAMKNMLYGKDKHPLKEKDLTLNNYASFVDDTTVEEFITAVSALIDRSNLSEWNDKLIRQDVRSVGELRSLTVGDWENLSLSVFGSRVIKNIVFAKGKITKGGKII